MLESVGVTEAQERCYRVLLDRNHAGFAELAGALGIGRVELQRILDSLEEKGLVTRTPAARPEYVAARPDLAVEALVLHRQEELERARAEAARLMDAFQLGVKRAGAGQVVDLVTGRDAVARWWVQVQQSARIEVLIFDKRPYVTGLTVPNPVELELLSQGIGYRIIYDQDSLQPDKLNRARVCVEAGEQARVLADVPMKLIIADARIALATAVTEVIEESLVVHPSALLTALVALFETLWQRATPLFLDPPDSGAESHNDIDRRIVTLLVAGAKDEAISRHLGLGLRTVRRRVAEIMDVLEARTRFQAGFEAARRGWLEAP